MKASIKNTILFYICYSAVFLLMLLYQYPEGISGSSLILFISVVGVICFYLNLNVKSNITAPITTLAVLFSFATLIGGLSSVNGEDFINSLVKAILWFFVFNIGAYFNCNRVKLIHITILVSLYTAMSCYYESMSLSSDYSLLTGFYEVTTMYYLLLVIPFLLCIPNRTIKSLFLVAATFFCIMSFKRTIILALLLIGILWFIKAPLPNKTKRRYVLFAFAIVGVYLITKGVSSDVGNILDLWEHRFESGDSGDGWLGERGGIYEDMLNLLANSNPFELLFGHGYNSVMYSTKSGFSAHNDFLELGYDYGIISLIIYLVLLYRLLRNYLRLEKNNVSQINGVPFFSILVSLALTVFCGFFSHLITYATHFLTIALFWGWISPCFTNSINNKYE